MVDGLAQAVGKGLDCHEAEDLVVADLLKPGHFFDEHYVYVVFVDVKCAPITHRMMNTLKASCPFILNFFDDPLLTNSNKLAEYFNIHDKVHGAEYILNGVADVGLIFEDGEEVKSLVVMFDA